MDRLAVVGTHIAVGALVGTVVDIVVVGIVGGSQIGVQVVDMVVAGIVAGSQLGAQVVDIAVVGIVAGPQIGVRVVGSAIAVVPADTLVGGRPVEALPDKLAASQQEREQPQTWGAGRQYHQNDYGHPKGRRLTQLNELPLEPFGKYWWAVYRMPLPKGIVDSFLRREMSR